MADDRSMEAPQISRSGRVLKKSAKVKEMEDFDINELDVQGKFRKKKTVEDLEDLDDKRVAPIKIPKISFSMQGTKKKMGEVSSAAGKQVFKPSFQGSAKGKQDARRQIYNDSSDGSKESDSSSVSSESSSSSSSPTSTDASDNEDLYNSEYRNDRKVSLGPGLQSFPVHQEKVIVEHYQQQYQSPVYMEPSSSMSSDISEDGASDAALVIAEDSDESTHYASKGPRGSAKKGITKKDPSYAPRQGGARRKPLAKNTGAVATKKKPAVAKPKPLSAYVLWFSENRKKIAASSGNIGFSNIGRKMGEAWQALPEKEKMIWRRKAENLAKKSAGNIISTGTTTAAQSETVNEADASVPDEKGLTENAVLGTTPIDAAAHLKLLGDSLTVIGQRLIEHEGQLAVSGIYSVMLDTLLCAIGPLLCLTTEITGLENLDTDVFKRTLDHIAYFMPGL